MFRGGTTTQCLDDSAVSFAGAVIGQWSSAAAQPSGSIVCTSHLKTEREDKMTIEKMCVAWSKTVARGGDERVAQHKRYRPVVTTGQLAVGKHWVDRPMVPYTGNPDDGSVRIDPEEIGQNISQIEWPDNAAALREYAIKLAERGE